MKLQGKNIVVTGASAGMGNEITKVFVNEGANVVAVARRKERLEDLAASLADASGKIEIYVGDIRKREVNEGMIDFAIEKFGSLEVLVNNAGVMDDMSAIGDMTDEMLENLMTTNTYGPLCAMRKAVNVFLEQEEGGNIINIASVGALHNTAGVAYGASKAALVSATKSTAYMYLEEEIRCNAIAPGAIKSEIAKSMPKTHEYGAAQTQKLIDLAVSIGMTEDIAAAALFLASDDSSYVNGTVLTVDGGWTTF